MSESLLNLIAKGQAGAEAALLDRYGGLVWSLANRFCANRAEAEDAVQEIMLDVWKTAKQGRFDSSKGSDTTFVAMIARRRLIDRLRKRKSAVEIPSEFEADLPEKPATRTDPEDVRAAMLALSDLSEAQQNTIKLSILHGLTHEQIVEATGMPLGTVKTHIRRGLIRLREAMQSRAPGEEVGR